MQHELKAQLPSRYNAPIMKGLRRGWLHRNPAREHTALHPESREHQNAYGAASASARRLSTGESTDLFYSQSERDSTETDDKDEE